MICNECQELKPIENRDLGLCASCNKERRDQVDEDLYPEVRKEFLAMCIRVEATCPITREPISMDSDIHHKRGRVGYADKWARDNDISLLIDVRYFLAVSRVGHTWIELNPKKARQMGLSMPRNEDPTN
jgi:hypothetical protein